MSVESAVDSAEVVGDEQTVAVDNARKSVDNLRGLAEPARGGRLIDQNINDIAAELDAAINALVEAVAPVDQDVSAISKFLKDLTDALDEIRSKHVE